MLPLLAAFALLASPSAGTDCAALKSLSLPDTTLTASELVAAGALTLPGGAPRKSAPALCRVSGVLHASDDSVIRFEVWLPAAGWNGRLLNVGNGGFAGSIGYSQMAANVEHGYATAGCDAGHQAEAEDASWAFHHPEKIKDFGYRAVHLTALRSKEIVKAFYGEPQKKAYFDSCSDGGREALMEAQRFPEDYDGILAGAPAGNWTHMLAGGVALAQANGRDPQAYLSSVKLPAIHRAVLAACDAQDGVKDGILSDPEQCKFDPAVLLCKGTEDSSCLTSPQIATLRTIYSGARDKSGKQILPGLAPGGEDQGWHDWVLGNAPEGSGGTNYVRGFFRYMVYSDPLWQVLTADVEEALQKAMSGPAKDIDATDPDLARFAARNGKLIVYHGWNDPAISPWNSIGYVQAATASLGTARAANTLRLYMAPGVGHCAGGPGPDSFGQLSLPPAAGAGTGALDLLQTWVEQGKAPGTLLAAKVGGTKEKPTRTVRPLCPYPQIAKYNGRGNANVPESFACVAP